MRPAAVLNFRGTYECLDYEALELIGNYLAQVIHAVTTTAYDAKAVAWLDQAAELLSDAQDRLEALAL